MQRVTAKRTNIAKENCNEWVSLQTEDNHWNVMPSEIKVLCNKIIVCSEIPFSKKLVSYRSQSIDLQSKLID